MNVVIIVEIVMCMCMLSSYAEKREFGYVNFQVEFLFNIKVVILLGRH